MNKEDKKSDRIPVSGKTRMRLKKYYVIKNLKSYDDAINLLLDKIGEKTNSDDKN